VTTLRAATLGDAAAIAAVHLQSSRETYDWTAAQIAAPKNTPERRTAFWDAILTEGKRKVLVAEADGRIVGFVCGGAMPESLRGRPPIPGYDAYVYTLYILAAWHERGIGRALLGTLAQRLREDGFESLALHVTQTNPARTFYERLGAQFIAAEPFDEAVDEGVQLAYGWRNIRAVPTGTLSVDGSTPRR
jgi:ribosomal protein S18 acetylase RimI-like enzyme